MSSVTFKIILAVTFTLVESATLYIVATPIGNLGDISARARDVLGNVDEVWAEDTRHSRRLFDHLHIAPNTFACHDHNEAERVDLLLGKLADGKSVALISDAGTPLISDPGFRLVRACRTNGFAVCPIPGASALTAALSVSGLPTDRFCFEGFLPSKSTARAERLQQLRDETRTLVFYESSHRIVASVNAMRDCFGCDREAAIARELTKLHETVTTGTFEQLSKTFSKDANQKKGEFVVIVAGATVEESNVLPELRRVLALLLPEMSAKRAAAVAAKITGASRNQAYQMALELRN